MIPLRDRTGGRQFMYRIFAGLVAVLIPLPFMALGVLVLIVQTLVFTMLTCVYIGLATEHEAH